MQYDLFVINLVLRLLRDEFPDYANSTQINKFEGFVASAALFGSMFGQIVAGNMADIIGRKVIFVVTAILITIGAFLSASTVDSPGFPIYYRISMCRFILGVGVGGEYPLAATVTSESSSAKSRGSLMCAVFAMQGVGSLLSVVIVWGCLTAGLTANVTWRIALAFGAVPVVIAFPWRLRMHETETFQQVNSDS
jgi:PHS family inorganic phosphate transporter-like MFS transporter